jgi:hypothetical protein
VPWHLQNIPENVDEDTEDLAAEYAAAAAAGMFDIDPEAEPVEEILPPIEAPSAAVKPPMPNWPNFNAELEPARRMMGIGNNLQVPVEGPSVESCAPARAR